MFVVLRIPGIGGVSAIGIVIWLIGLVAVIMLWQRRRASSSPSAVSVTRCRRDRMEGVNGVSDQRLRGKMEAWPGKLKAAPRHEGSCGSTSAPPREWGRRTPCSARGTGAASAARTWSSRSRETHGRPQTAALLDGLEVVPRQRLTYRGATFEEMDIDAVLARKPQIALVDELAHTNVPGSRHEKRWQDVEELLDAGIDVISAVNIQHLESLNDVVEQITGVPQRETVPDAVVRAADQVELVDMTAEALRRRMAHGNIYPPEKIDAALTNYFRTGNLTALRELALLWLADKVDEGLQKYRAEHDIKKTWEARERVVVARDRRPGGRHADQARGADRGPVDRRRPARGARHQVRRAHRREPGEPRQAAPARRVPRRQLSPGRRRQHLGRAAHLRPGGERDPAGARRQPAVVAARPAHRAGHRVAHHPRLRRDRRAHRHPRAGGQPVGAAAQVPRRHHAAPPARRVRARGGARAAGHASCSPASRSGLNLTSDMLMYLIAVIAVALVGGFVPALLEAIAASLLLNYYFTPPIHQWTIAEANNVAGPRGVRRGRARGQLRWSTSPPGGPTRRRAPTPSRSCS